jgi:hypothetical protein
MWKIFQLLIFVGVVFANIRWELTPNGYLASLLGIILAFLATVAVSGLLTLGLKIKAWRRHQRLDQQVPPRIHGV